MALLSLSEEEKMSRSKRDQRGKRIAGEVWGYFEFKVIGDRLVPVGGGTEVGGPRQKRIAKREAVRMRRRANKAVTSREQVDFT